MLGHDRCATAVPFAVHISFPLKVIATQGDTAGPALEAVRVEFLAGARVAGVVVDVCVWFFGLEVVAFDARVAGGAEGAVELVVVLAAVGVVVENVKVGGLKGRLADVADEAGLVVTAG